MAKIRRVGGGWLLKPPGSYRIKHYTNELFIIIYVLNLVVVVIIIIIVQFYIVGIIKKWRKRYQQKNEVHHQTSTVNSPKVVTIQNIWSLFIILGCGSIAGLIILCLENAIKYSRFLLFKLVQHNIHNVVTTFNNI